MKKFVLTLLAALSLSAPSAQAGVTDIITTLLPHAFFANAPVFGLKMYMNAHDIAQKHGKKVEHEKAVAFISAEIAQITDQPVEVYICDGLYFACPDQEIAFTHGKNLLIIAPTYWKMLEAIFNKDEYSQQDLATLEILSFIIQHETGHIKHGHVKKRVIASIGCSAAAMALFEASKRLYTFTWSKRITFGGLLIASGLTQRALNFNQEYAADNSIVGEKAHAGGKRFFNNLINLKKTNAQWEAKEAYNVSHPKSEDRLKNLESRGVQIA